MAKRLRPSPALIIAVIALFVSIGGVGYAASKIGTNDIKNQAVTKQKIAKKAVSTNRIADGAVKTKRIGDDAVTGDKVNESTLGTVPSATNAAQLGGIAASGYAERIFARVQYSSASPTIIASSPGISTNGEGALGFPRVVFPRNMDNCAVVAEASSATGTQIVRRSTTVTGTQVQFALKDENGNAVRANFDLIAVC